MGTWVRVYVGTWVRGTFIEISKWQWRLELETVPPTNSCNWLEEPFDRKCDVCCGTSRNSTCFNPCSEWEIIIDLNVLMEL